MPAKSHGMSGTPTYVSWAGIIQRCHNKNYREFYLYGGRGISVCERWCRFENFFADMGERPNGMSIDRINNNGDYEPGNCRWATDKTQVRNSTKARNVCIGTQERCIAEWLEVFGLSRGTFKSRRARGWSIERAITTPAAWNARWHK